MGVRGVSWWGVVPSAASPVLLAGGWTAAAGLQPQSYDPVADTVSALAALGATDRWVMTIAFVAASICEFVTALALRPARMPGRLILMVGAVAGVLVAASPEGAGAPSPRHAIFAIASLGALAVWPAAAWRHGPAVPWALRPAAAAWAVGVLLVLLAVFGAELVTGAGLVGLAERVLGLAQAGWPFVVVVSCRHPKTEGTFRGVTFGSRLCSVASLGLCCEGWGETRVAPECRFLAMDGVLHCPDRGRQGIEMMQVRPQFADVSAMGRGDRLVGGLREPRYPHREERLGSGFRPASLEHDTAHGFRLGDDRVRRVSYLRDHLPG